MFSLEHKLDEVPLMREADTTGFYIFGLADIAFDAAGEWHVADIWIESHGKKKVLPLDKSSPLWKAVEAAIIREDGDSIQSKVDEQLGWEGISIPSDRAMHSTYVGQP